MKNLRRSLIIACLAVAGATHAAVPPTLLLRDTFDAATANVNDLNVDLARQSGLLAPLSYTMAFGPGHYGHQLQNGNAVNQLLVADFPNSTSSLNQNFNGANSAGGLKISFDLDSVPTVYGGTPDNWGCINLGMSAADQLANVNQGVAHFGILFRAAGTIQAFDGSAVVSPGPEPVYSTRPPGTFNHIDLIITDADGNPFDGTGNTVINVYANGGAAPVYSFTKTGGYANNFINVQGSFRAHFDNLEVLRLDPGFENPSFEANSFTVFPGYVSGNGPIVGWTAVGGAGLNPASGSPFADNGTIPNGSQVAFIQNGADASLSTVIPNLTIGQAYKVNFRVNARSGNTPNLKVDIDGNNIISTAITPVTGSNPYKYFAFDFTATATSQTLRLRNDAGGDNTVVLDDFSIAPRTSGWSYAAWNDDATSGVDGSRPYTHAYNFGSTAGTTINGVAFTGIGGANPAVAGQFATTGLGATFANDGNNVTGGSRTLANDFVYNGFPATITINNLIVGGEYIATIYSVGWEDGTRAATFNVGNDRLTVNQDHFNNNNGIRFIYRYVATSSSITLTYAPLQGNSIHTYGFSNQELSTPNNVPPSITVQPQDVTVGLGDTATFTVAAVGSQPLNYQWYFGNDILSGQFNPTLSVPTGFGDEAGDYYAVVSNNAGSITSRVARLTLRAKVPGLFNTGVDDSGNAISDGAVDPHYSFVVNADSTSTDSIVQNSGAFPIVTGPWIANTAGSKWIGPRFDTAAAAGLAQGNGTYVYRTTFDLTGIDRSSVVITGGWAVDNNGVSIKVNGIATGLVNGNGFGGLTAFTINAQNASFIDGVNTLEFEVQNADAVAGYTGLYVGNLKGLAELPGTPPGVITQPQSQLAGTGESITFSVVASGSSPLSYQWRKGGNNIPNANDASYTIPNVAKSDAGVYSVHISNPVGNTNSADATLTVRDSIPGIFNTGVDDSKIALADNSADSHYKLLVNADGAADVALVQDSTVFPIVAGPWVANNASSKWIGPRLETSAAAGGDYTYRTTVDVTGFDPSDVVVTGLWSSDNEGIEIYINGQPTGQNNTTQFVGLTPFTISSGFVAGINTIDFKLNNAALGYTGLKVEKARALGTALPPGTAPFIITQPQSVTADLGETVTFHAVANGSAPMEYQWFVGADPLPGETRSILSFLFDFPDLAGDYSVRISNAFGSVTTTPAKLQLRSVNQPPSFTKGPDVTVAEANTPAAYPFPNWATNIRSGPAGEAPQNLTFIVTSDNPGLLSASINPANGLLSVTVTPYSNGVANVTVVLKDDGGTDNGGVDTSAPQTFVVTVLPVNDCPTASGRSVTLNEDTATSVTLAASDVEGSALTYTITTAPAHGTLSGTAPSLTYTPTANYCGTDSFSFKASDGQCDSSVVTVSLQINCVNDVPTAKIVITPLTTLEGLENPVVISANNSNACVTLDGSLSTDVDSTALTYLWLLDASPIPFAAEAVATQCLEIGVHTITLAVSDDAGGTGTATETVEVITAGEAVDLLVALVNDSTIERKNKRPFIASLKAAGASFDRGNNTSAINQLHAFQNKVRAQVGKTNPVEAAKWIRLAQSIIDAVATE